MYYFKINEDVYEARELKKIFRSSHYDIRKNDLYVIGSARSWRGKTYAKALSKKDYKKEVYRISRLKELRESLHEIAFIEWGGGVSKMNISTDIKLNVIDKMIYCIEFIKHNTEKER